ncbi:simple sugar transport system permease protein [Rhodobium orientis]|uniref:Sugar ABC transporter permease n=1 Tax=Rhodobium orientis TaxID=34017 RepID=A0A327JMG9_9HYPH|nr:ABC transporter permease [Rhodobium orientis]MBB4304567.1 simple sugar transport system permease protein [Rhodobium orientis]MBK5951398.1 sugar ABC transporter permease [Rhodobium orientis]RAI27527.1 sugar ABC transporter permease [Rhodobium orientis]
MRRMVGSVEGILFVILLALCVVLSLATDSFFSMQNFFDLLNNQSVNIIFAVGLVVVLIAGGIDISFSVAASVVQYVVVVMMIQIGGGNWLLGFVAAMVCGLALGLFNAFLIHKLRIVSIIASIGTYNLFFGLLMYLTRGRSIYAIPDWLDERVALLTVGADRAEATLYLPALVMLVVVSVAWFILARTGFGRLVYGFGSDPEAARRSGVRIAVMQGFAYGWLGLCAGIAGLMQAHMVREVVPNALYGRELDVLAAVVLGGAVLGGGRGTVLGAALGVLLLAVVQNGLNLLGVTPYAFKAIVGAIILIAVTFTNFDKVAPLIGLSNRKARTT